MATIDTFKIYCDGRLAAWGREIRSGATNLSYPSTNLLHRDHGTIGSGRVEMSELCWQTEEIMREVRKEASMEAAALEAFYVWGDQAKGETSIFKTGFDRVVEFFDFLAKTS